MIIKSEIVTQVEKIYSHLYFIDSTTIQMKIETFYKILRKE